MKLTIAWMFVIFFLSAAKSAELLRTKRDLTRIQNFVRWFLGADERCHEQSVPLVENVESERIFAIPGYENIIFRTVPQDETNLYNIKRIFFDEVRYPDNIMMPVQSTRNTNPRNSNPIVLKKIPSHAMQEYVKETNSHRNYEYEIPVNSYINKLPAYKELITPLNSINRDTLEGCIYDESGAIVATTGQPLPVPPVYIQNRIREIILGSPIPLIPTARREEVNYLLQVDRRKGHETVKFVTSLSQNEYNKAESPKPITKSSSTFQSKSGGESRSNINSPFINNAKKTVTFTDPVHSRYIYKMVYHNEPHKNTIVKMENSNFAGPNEQKLSTQSPPVSSTTIDHASMPLKVIQNELPADYLFVPPDSTEDLPPLIHFKSAATDTAFNNTPMPVYDQSTYKNSVPLEVASAKRTSLYQQCKLSPSRDVNRGDIP